jgi:predicted transport protein
LTCQAQNKSVTKTFEVTDFDKIALNNVNGEVKIEVGKPFSVSITMDSQDFENLQVEKGAEYKLTIALTKKKGNWYEGDDAKITITMPEISKLYNNSNANVSIANIKGRYLGIENNSNGDVVVKGQIVDLLDIENIGNGDVKTKNLEAKEVNVGKYGNGNVEIKTNQTFKAKLAGNGDIVNFGSGMASIAKQSGNGKAINR